MKKIQKTITNVINYYICETCNNEYSSEFAAVNCELRHLCNHDAIEADYYIEYEENQQCYILSKTCKHCKNVIKYKELYNEDLNKIIVDNNDNK